MWGIGRRFFGGRSSAADRVEKGCSIGIRKMVRFFFKEIHPDLTPHFPDASKKVNQNSLGELNAFIDLLDSKQPHQDDIKSSSVVLPCITGTTLTFFKQYRTTSGKSIAGRVQPICVTLPSLKPNATFIERETIAVRLIRDLQKAIQQRGGEGFSDTPSIPPLFPSSLLTKENMERLWDDNVYSAIAKGSVYQPHRSFQNETAKRTRAFRRFQSKLFAKAESLSNKVKRRQLLKTVDKRAAQKVLSKFGAFPKETAAEAKEQLVKTRIIGNGYHPDLVFVHPSLGEPQRTEAIERVCGKYLATDSDVWLLENLWKAMRNGSVSVPIVLTSDTQFGVSPDSGFVLVPYNFDVWRLADFLEENLEEARQKREQILQELRKNFR